MAIACEANVLKALKSCTKKLSFDNNGLSVLPESIARLKFLEILSVKSNNLTCLPEELAHFERLTYLNLGRNKLQVVATCVCGLPKLQTLHLFHNCLTTFPKQLPRTLVLLNLNDNRLTAISPSINQLTSLKQLSLASNSLTRLPTQLCSLYTLEELHLNDNKLIALPPMLGRLVQLKKLLLQKNQLTALPSSIGSCRKLVSLDVSGNQLSIFPAEIQTLSIQDLHFENNPLIPFVPVPADQFQEVMPLKETASRVIVSELRRDSALMSAMVSYYPSLQDQLDRAGSCAVCGQPFVGLWLDCVHFELPKKVFPKLHTSTQGYLPMKAQVCTYKCFNTDGHKLFGIAEPSTL